MSRATILIMAGVGLLAAGWMPAVETTHEAKGLLAVAGDTRAQTLSSFCLDPKENIIACDEGGKCLRVVSPADKLLAKWAVGFSPQAVACSSNGLVVVGGAGRVALLDADGKVLAGTNVSTGTSADVTSVAIMGDDVLVCHRGQGGYTVTRLDVRLQNPKGIIRGLGGCCGQMDLTARDGTIYVALNCEAKIGMYNRDGRRTASFGKSGAANYFDGCCEPKNVCLGADGSIYAAESAQCCINRFSADGKLLERVGVVKDISSCVRVTVAVTRDAARVYMLDTEKNAIRVLERRKKP